MKNTKSKYLNAATDLGLSLCRDAIWYDRQCTWMTALNESNGNKSQIYFHSTDADFYSGLSGIAYFLGSLSRFSDDPIFRETAEGAIRQALAIKDNIASQNRLGFFIGWSGLAYSLFALGDYLEEPKWIKEGEKLINEIIHLDPTQSGIDVIDGAAGAIPALIKIYKRLPSPELKNYISGLGRHLVQLAEKEESGISWKTMEEAKQNLTGFAHGASGIINAMLELYSFLNEPEFLELANEAMEYEDSFFNKEKQNWPDFRDFEMNIQNQNKGNEDDKTYACTWCHGAPGIGLARLKAFVLTGSEKCREDLEASLSTTIQETGLQFSMGHSLCHGVFGNAELALSSHPFLNDPALKEYAEKVGDYALENFIEKDIPLQNGNGNDFSVPDFMTGNSGMGYYYLRLYNPKACPSILMLGNSKKSKATL